MADFFGQPYDFVIDAIDQMRVKVAMANYFVKHKQAFILSGGAGGQRNPALIQTADLSQTTHDPLLSNVRYNLRKNNGFSRARREMRVPVCVFAVSKLRHHKFRLPVMWKPHRHKVCRVQVMGRVCWLRRVLGCIAPLLPLNTL